MYELEVTLVCWIITAKKIAFYLVIIFALLFYFLEACFSILQDSQLAGSADTGPEVRAWPGARSRVNPCSASPRLGLSLLASPEQGLQGPSSNTAFRRGAAHLRPLPSLFRASGVLSFLVRKKSLEEPLQKERLSPRGGPLPAERAPSRTLPSRRLQTPAFTTSAGLGCAPPAPPRRWAGPAGKAPAELRGRHHRAGWGSVPESSGLRRPSCGMRTGRLNHPLTG